MDLVVIGSANMDLVIYLPKIPAVGETVLGGKSSMVFGGKGANQAVAAIRAGGNVAFIAKVGDDIFGKSIKTHFENEGFGSLHILTDKNESTGIAQIFVSENGENSIAVAPGANMQLSPKDIKPYTDLIKNAKVVLVQLEIPLETVTFIAEIAYRNKVKFILNPAPAAKLDSDLLKKVWLLTPNETEASILSGISINDIASATIAAEHFIKLGIKNTIITLGEKGSLLYNENGGKHFKAFKTKAVDTTAAGDVFNGTLAVSIANEVPLQQAIKFASAAAAISVTRKGAQSSIPTLSEIENYLINN